jgi:hypothetical protein
MRYFKLKGYTGNYGIAISLHPTYRLLRVMLDRQVIHETRNKKAYKISKDLADRYVGFYIRRRK